MKYLGTMTVLLLVALGRIQAQQADALVDALVQEGVLDHDQAERVRTKVAQAQQTPPAHNVAISANHKKPQV